MIARMDMLFICNAATVPYCYAIHAPHWDEDIHLWQFMQTPIVSALSRTLEEEINHFCESSTQKKKSINVIPNIDTAFIDNFCDKLDVILGTCLLQSANLAIIVIIIIIVIIAITVFCRW